MPARLHGGRHDAGEHGDRGQVAGPPRRLPRRADRPQRKNSPRLAVRPDQVKAVLAIVDAAKKDVYFHGLATAGQIERVVATKFPGAAGRNWCGRPCSWSRVLLAGQEVGLVPHRGHRQARAAQDDRQGVGGGRRRDGPELRRAMGRNRSLWRNRRRRTCCWSSAATCRACGSRAIESSPIRRATGGVAHRRGTEAGQRVEGARPGHGTRRNGGHLRRRRHEPLQLPRLRLLVAGHRAVGS